MTDTERAALWGHISALQTAVRLVLKRVAEQTPDGSAWLAQTGADCLAGLANAERSIGLNAQSEVMGDSAASTIAALFRPLDEP